MGQVYLGSDAGTFDAKISKPIECHIACIREPQCLVWTLLNDKCVLVSTVMGVAINSTAVSGTKRCEGK